MAVTSKVLWLKSVVTMTKGAGLLRNGMCQIWVIQIQGPIEHIWSSGSNSSSIIHGEQPEVEKCRRMLEASLKLNTRWILECLEFDLRPLTPNLSYFVNNSVMKWDFRTTTFVLECIDPWLAYVSDLWLIKAHLVFVYYVIKHNVQTHGGTKAARTVWLYQILEFDKCNYQWLMHWLTSGILDLNMS